jgi:hypothetical protein
LAVINCKVKMKIILLSLLIPLLTRAQYEPNEKIPLKAKIITDTGIIKGYYVDDNDSVFTFCTQRKYTAQANVKIPVGTIKELHLKNKSLGIPFVAGMCVISFIVTAGLSQHSDIDNDGKTSFFELVLSAIDGSSSQNRKRRKTALIVGAAGGTAGLLAGIFTRRKLSLVFPITNRHNFYTEKKQAIRKFVDF